MLKLVTRVTVVAASAAIALLAPMPVAAGPIDPPPGPVSPTHKTLSEVEPRIPVNAANTPGDADSHFRITQPGSYYLVGNLTGQSGKHGIEIESDDVTLDLNGFALRGAAGSLSGISMPGFRTNVVIRNGNIQGWGGSGIEARIDSGRIEGISATSNLGDGIFNRSTAFMTNIHNCEALSNGASGIRTSSTARISDCIARSNGGAGILASIYSSVTGCVSVGNTADGIVISNGIITDCYAAANSGNGISVAGDTLVRGNTLRGNTAAGIRLTAGDNRVEDNLCISNARGIDVDAAGNIIIRNTCSGNTTNFDIVGGNITGTVVATEAAMNAAANGNVNISF